MLLLYEDYNYDFIRRLSFIKKRTYIHCRDNQCFFFSSNKMTNTTGYLTIQKYNFMSEQLTKYVGPFLYIICLVGTIMNMLTFLQENYQSRSGSLYLFVASACDFVHLTLDPLSNILQYGFNYDWIVNSLVYCRTKSYFAFAFIIISGTLTTLASVSQFLLSSEKSTYWYYARRHIGIRCTKITFVFWFIVSIPIIFCSKRFPHIFQNGRLICSNPARHITCYSVRLIYNCLFNGFLPPFIMTIFGFLAYKNARHLHRRSRNNSIQIRKINHQLASMLILQSIKSTFASIPFSIFNCYWLKTMYDNKSLLLQARENLIHQIVYLLFWSNYTSFFIYLCSSDIFRNQWIKAMRKIFCCFYGNEQQRYSTESSRRRSLL